MADVAAFPIPTLPAPGTAPAAPLTAPALAPELTPLAGLAAPTQPLSAPSLPTLSAPSLPTLSAPSLPTLSAPSSLPALPGLPTQPSLPCAGDAAVAPAPSDPAFTMPAAPVVEAAPPKRAGRSLGAVLPIMLVVGAAGLGFVGFRSMSGGSSDSPAAAPVEQPVATSPLVAPIIDAETVVADINDNPEVEQALDDLDLGPRGEPPVTEAPRVVVADATVGAALTVHAGDVIDDDLVSVLGAPSFKYTYQRGTTPQQAVWVDVTTGHREFFDGTTYVRVASGATHRTADPVGAWIADPAAAPLDALAGLGGMITFDDVLPAGMLDAVTISTVVDERGYGTYAFVDTDLAAIDPESRAAWLAFWGFDPASVPVAVDGFIDFVPESPRSGVILVTFAGSSEGIVTSLTIDAPSIGERVSYTLAGASMEPLTIASPTNIAG